MTLTVGEATTEPGSGSRLIPSARPRRGVPSDGGSLPARWSDAYVRRAVAIDGGAAALAATVVTVIDRRFAIDGGHALALVLVPLVWWAACAAHGLYDTAAIGVGREEFRRLVTCGANVAAVIAIVSVAAGIELTRSFFLLLVTALTALAGLGRYLLRRELRARRRERLWMSRVVAVGTESEVVRLVDEVAADPTCGLQIVGTCLSGSSMLETLAALDIDLREGLENIPEMVTRLRADTVAVAGTAAIRSHEVRRLAWQLESTRTDLVVFSGLAEIADHRLTVRPAANLTLLHVDHALHRGAARLAKGALDRVLAVTALALLAPLLLLVAVAVRCSSPGPAIYRQRRIGRDGRSFTMYKFRSMCVDADVRRTELLGLSDGNGVLFKMRRDPRVTRVGAVLRRYSLDELPQLVNVALGHMSLVGPRPPLPEEVARYDRDAIRRLRVKPGLTGLWQVSGRSDLSWEDSLRLDLRYVDNWSLALDFSVVWKTGRTVLRGTGAY